MINVITNLSANTLLNSSTKSRAKDFLPGLIVCINPTYGSNPTDSNAEVHIDVNNTYAKDNSAFTLSKGGLLLLNSKLKSSSC